MVREEYSCNFCRNEDGVRRNKGGAYTDEDGVRRNKGGADTDEDGVKAMK